TDRARRGGSPSPAAAFPSQVPPARGSPGTAPAHTERGITMSVQRLLSAAGLAAATVASAQTTELVSFGPAFFDEGGFVYSAFAEEGAVSFTGDSLILEATGFGGIAAPLDPPLGFEPTLHELHVTARRLPGNTAQNLRVALRDEDGGDAIEEYVYNFPVASFGADGFTTQTVPVPGYAFRNAGPSITPGAPDGDGKQNFGLIRWQLQSQFEIGRASCRERVWMSVVAVSLKKKLSYLRERRGSR